MLSLRGKVQKLRTDHASLSLDPKGIKEWVPIFQGHALIKGKLVKAKMREENCMERLSKRCFRATEWRFQNKLGGLPRWLSGKESTWRCRRHGFHSWSGKTPCTLEQLSLCATTPEARALGAHALQQEEPRRREACTLQPKSSPHLAQLEKSPRRNKDPVQPQKEKKLVRGHGARWATVHSVQRVGRYWETLSEREKWALLGFCWEKISQGKANKRQKFI